MAKPFSGWTRSNFRIPPRTRGGESRTLLQARTGKKYHVFVWSPLSIPNRKLKDSWRSPRLVVSKAARRFRYPNIDADAIARICCVSRVWGGRRPSPRHDDNVQQVLARMDKAANDFKSMTAQVTYVTTPTF